MLSSVPRLGNQAIKLMAICSAAERFIVVNASEVIKFTEEGDQCKFKADYFSEFDINPLTKCDTDDFYTSGEDPVFSNTFEFNVCADLPGAPVGIHVRSSNRETGEEILYGGEPTIYPYLDAYSTKITGSRGEGNVRGVKFRYESETECSDEKPRTVQVAVECDD